jgi:photosystem II stability/assembly factor-like uncharacterized protein
VLGVAAVGAALLWRPTGTAESATAWAKLATEDVHSLAFPSSDLSTVLFGHHGGILKSSDGGRQWQPLPVRQDAMGMAAATDGSVIIAGHMVFQGSQDGGATWAPIEADLPSLDIHSFARSPSDPSRMWAYLAEGGIYETRDGGQHWKEVYDGHVLNLTAVQEGGDTVLLGVESLLGLVSSKDGGTTWAPIGEPPVAPVTSLASTRDGHIIVVGGVDGLYRSDDAGANWRQILKSRAVLALAVSSDGSTIAAVDRDTFFYRSDDGGATWPGPG